MKELLKIFFVLFFISLLTFSTIGVFAEDSNSSNLINDTNSTNSTNSTNTTVTKNAVVQPMSISTSITVTPSSVNFGSLPADGLEYTYAGVTTVQVSATGLWILTPGNVTVRAGNDFTRGTDTSRIISLNNFKYDCSGDSVVAKTSFTKDDVAIDQFYPISNQYAYTLHYYLTIPKGTDPGVYNTTITYTAN